MKEKINTLKQNKFFIFLVFSFIILTIPRSVEEVFPILYKIINIIKVIVTIFIVYFAIVKKIKFSKLSIGLLIYVVYLGIVTILNKENPIVFLKVYALDLSIAMLVELVFKSEYKDKFIIYFSNYLFALIVLNSSGIIGNLITTGKFVNPNNIYLLGQDNRFILYIIPTLLGYYLRLQKVDEKSTKIKLILTYIIGLATLIILWSVTSFLALLLIGFVICFNYTLEHKKINIDIDVYTITTVIMVICILIVFFKIQNIFKDFIINVLHKSMTLSYRTILWDDAIEMLKENPVNMLFGFGYFDTTNTFTNIAKRVNHLHNIIMDPLFTGGIIGLILYLINLFLIQKSIDSIRKRIVKNNISVIFIGLLILLIFDTFEMYALYYFILFMLYNYYFYIENKEIDDLLDDDLKKLTNIIKE